jgi:sigma-B regulation protein RsbU (phosphoserine phosphatase)
MNILIAEDEMVSRRLLEKFLTENGHKVTSASGGTEAWQSFLREKTRVIISDWRMPDLSGLDLCRRIRATNREEYTYFILLSGVSRTRDNFMQAAQAGVDDFLSKPLHHDEIWMRLRVAERILSCNRQIQELESILPICAYCKKIRDDGDYWEQLETYMTEHAGLDFSHSICPECYDKHVMPELAELKKSNGG